MRPSSASRINVHIAYIALIATVLGTTARPARGEAGEVLDEQKISKTSGFVEATLDQEDHFGHSVAPLGDFDGDGVADLAVGAPLDANKGCLWILLLNDDGTVKSEKRIGAGQGGFLGTLANGDQFGSSVAALGDLDDDGVTDLAVGAQLDDQNGGNAGAVWILFLNANGTVKAHVKILALDGARLSQDDYFGSSVAALGDLDGDGVNDLAVGAALDDVGGSNRGALWILCLNSDGTIKTQKKISATLNGFVGPLDDNDQFGVSVAPLGDLDGDGVTDLAVGAYNDDDGTPPAADRGAVWILFLNPDRTVKSEQKISAEWGGFAGALDGSDYFGESLAALSDLNGDGVTDLAVGAFQDDDGTPPAADRGAVWILFLNTDGTVESEQKISATSGGFGGPLAASDGFGHSVAALGDLDGDGLTDLAVGANLDDDGGTPSDANIGAVWVLFLNTDGTVATEKKINAMSSGLGGFDVGAAFGRGAASLGDLDGDGVNDLAVGSIWDDDGGSDAGAVWILFLNEDGSARSTQKINATSGSFGGALTAFDYFGWSVTALGDVNGDGVTDLAVGAYGDDDGGSDKGAVWILFLDDDGTVKSEQKISATAGGFGGPLDPNDQFGMSVAPLGDLDGDGVNDLATGSSTDDDGADSAGAVWILFLNDDGTVHDHQKISKTSGGFIGPLDQDDYFGYSVTALGDLDGDGVCDLAVGAIADDDGQASAGAVWILFLNTDGTVKDEQKISATFGGFVGVLDSSSYFGGAGAALGDLDGDGVNDLAVGAFGDDDGGVPPGAYLGAVWILFLNEDGTVHDHQKISATSGSFGGGLDVDDAFGIAIAAPGDVNRDGRPDLAVGAVGDDDGGSETGAVWILFLDGAQQPTFDPPSEFIAAGAGDFVATGDLDTDGDEDAVIVVPGDDQDVIGHVQVFLNQGSDGNGGWLGLVALPAIVVGPNPSGVAVGFLDGDLLDPDFDLDIAVANAGDHSVSILINTGLGNGSFDVLPSFAISGLRPVSIAAADFTGDGLTDLATANAGDNTVGFIVNLDGEMFFNGQNVSVPGAPTAIEPEIIDDDKPADCLVTIGPNHVAVIENFGGGTFNPIPIVLPVGDDPVDLASGDLDGNGFPDIATADNGASTVSIILNDGALEFAPSFPVLVGTSPQSVQLVDMDNDTDLDLVVVADDLVIGPAVQILENLGAPGPLALGGAPIDFGPPVSFEVGANPNYVVSADLDGDELSDLVTANSDPADPANGSVSVLLNLPCPSDIDSSGDVGFGDVTTLLLNWGTCPAPPANCPWDRDHNGTVGFNDLTLLLVGWGACE